MSVKPVRVIAADFHLRERAWERYPGLEGDSYYGLSQVVDVCVSRGLSLVGLGDLFDERRPSPRSMVVAQLAVEKMRQADLDFWYLRGNHDMTDPAWLSLFPHAVPLGGCCYEAGGLLFAGLDYQPRDLFLPELCDMLNVYSRVDVLCCHQAWRELSGGRCDAAVSDLFGVRCLASGDLHRSVIATHLDSSGLPVVVLSPGALCLQAIDEPDEHYCLVLYDDLSVERVKLRSRPVVRLAIDSTAALGEAISTLPARLAVDESLPPGISKPIVDVRLSPGVPDAHSVLTSALAGQAHLFVRLTKESVQPPGAAEAADGPQPGLLDGLAETLGESSRAYSHGSRLLSGNDPDRVLDEIEDEIVSHVIQDSP
jgi:hypothetical protein